MLFDAKEDRYQFVGIVGRGDTALKRICFGTLITILYQARNSSKVTNDVLCTELFSVYGEDFKLCGSSSGHLKSGHDNQPSNLKDKASKMDFGDTDRAFQTKIVPLIKETKKEAVVRAIKKVLEEDTTIPDNRVVGYQKGYEKKNIIEYPKVSFSALLASLFFYAITEVDNTKCADGIKEITKCYVDDFENSDVVVSFESSDAESVMPLDRSMIDPAFKRTFEKVSEMTIGVPNPSTAQIYCVDIMNQKFRFKNTKDFLFRNISKYVSSREKANKMDKLGKMDVLGMESLLKYMQACQLSPESILGETLLYVFLEQELRAPKIMSKIEINDIGGSIKSRSDGVHLLASDNRGLPFTQLVFGASSIVGDICSAVDSVFDKILAIEDNYENEFQIIDNTENYNIFSPEVNNYIKSILIPEKNKTQEHDMAFGCFLGYTIKLPYEEKNAEKHRELVRKTMADEIVQLEAYIKQKIAKHGLEGYSFYFYILPFNDAPSEKIGLVNEMLGGNLNANT